MKLKYYLMSVASALMLSNCAQEETPQGRESILNLLTYCEQYYSNAEFEEDDALPKCRAIRATHQALNK